MATTDSNMEDLQSLNLIRQGGKLRDQGVTELYRKYAKHLGDFLIAQSGLKVGHGSLNKLNKNEAEEIVQDAFIKVLINCEHFKGDSTFKTWLFSIALNCMNDYFRQIIARPATNLDDDGWDSLSRERQSDPRPDLYAGVGLNPDTQTLGTVQGYETLEDCVKRGFAEFARNFSERAYVLSLVMEGFDTAHIAAAIQRTPGATREFISQSRKRIEEFLLPCKEYLSAA